MTKLIFATHNQHKVEEIQAAIGNLIEVISLKQAGIDIDIPEPHETLEANAAEKSRTIHLLTHRNCFSEDTGLEVEALNGAPGVRSARYAGDEKSFDKNIDKLLHEMEGRASRRARFRTVVSLILDDREYLFEGICEGRILTERRGLQGFGYDPVFMPEESRKTFAEMDLAEKNKFSHRKKAADKMIAFLRERANSLAKLKT
jgi:XTP/dITP diphosphohydrolase